MGNAQSEPQTAGKDRRTGVGARTRAANREIQQQGTQLSPCHWGRQRPKRASQHSLGDQNTSPERTLSQESALTVRHIRTRSRRRQASHANKNRDRAEVAAFRRRHVAGGKTATSGREELGGQRGPFCETAVLLGHGPNGRTASTRGESKQNSKEKQMNPRRWLGTSGPSLGHAPAQQGSVRTQLTSTTPSVSRT